MINLKIELTPYGLKVKQNNTYSAMSQPTALYFEPKLQAKKETCGIMALYFLQGRILYMAIKKLNRRHLELAQCLLYGRKQREAAKRLNFSEWHVSRICRSPVFIEYMNRLQDEADAAVLETLRMRHKEIVERNIALMRNPRSSKTDRIKAAGALLKQVAATTRVYGR